MNKGTKKFKYGLKKGAYMGFAIIFISLGLGCASTRKTTTTETTVTTTYPSADQEQRALNRGYIIRNEDESVAEKSETTSTTETKAGRPGILSSTLHAVGYVIALPFIVVGGLFRIIFGG